MIHFMIDYENVRSTGLHGSEYLQSDDRVTVFYSESCRQVEQGEMKNMFSSGCEFDICKLMCTGKNALDFYIASRIGQIYGAGYQGDIAIVSRDKGFHAVQDYWKRMNNQGQVILKPDIEQCIAASGENSERRFQIQEKKKVVNLEKEFDCYKERKRIQTKINDLFSDGLYLEDMGKIIDILQKKSSPKVLYLDVIKSFGKENGLDIYRKIKNVV